MFKMSILKVNRSIGAYKHKLLLLYEEGVMSTLSQIEFLSPTKHTKMHLPVHYPRGSSFKWSQSSKKGTIVAMGIDCLQLLLIDRFSG